MEKSKTFLSPLQKPEFYVLVFLCFIAFYKIAFDLKPYPTGDAAEYILTTESFYNHAGPSINSEDFKSFKAEFLKKKEWWEISKPEFFNQVEEFVAKENKTFKENFAGIFVAKNNKLYSYHFPFYSLVNLPARIFCHLFHRNPLGAFQLTNAILILLTCALILFSNSSLNRLAKIFISLAFFFSSVYWYLGWVHPEVMTACLVACSLWYLWQDRFLPAIWLMVLASLQNQPLLVMVGFLSLLYLIQFKLKARTVLNLVLPGLVSLSPSLFYYYHFGTFNLVKDQGFLSDEVVTFTRIFGFFFDPNQGIILAIPVALILFFYFIIFNLKYFKEWTSHKKLVLLPLAITIMILSFSTMKNWNHGQAVIIRYGVWISTIVLLFVMFQLTTKKSLFSMSIAGMVVLSQIGTTIYHESLNKFDWTWFEHKPLANYVLENYPEFYNPDPHIFFVRTTGKDVLDTSYGPVIFRDKYENIKKIMVHTHSEKKLNALGVDTNNLFVGNSTRDKINGWYYLNAEEIPVLEFDVFQKTLKESSVESTKIRIRSTPEWMEQIKIKASEKNISVDSMITLDAIYILNQEQ